MSEQVAIPQETDTLNRVIDLIPGINEKDADLFVDAVSILAGHFPPASAQTKMAFIAMQDVPSIAPGLARSMPATLTYATYESIPLGHQLDKIGTTGPTHPLYPVKIVRRPTTETGTVLEQKAPYGLLVFAHQVCARGLNTRLGMGIHNPDRGLRARQEVLDEATRYPAYQTATSQAEKNGRRLTNQLIGNCVVVAVVRRAVNPPKKVTPGRAR